MKRSVNFRGSAPMSFGIPPGSVSPLPCGCEIRIGMESASLAECQLHKAAPDLLHACKETLDRYRELFAAAGLGDPDISSVAVKFMRDAIAKAEGK